MAQHELRMPKMGESIIEATILNWTKSPGDSIELDETILEIATDKVDSEIPSPVEGVLSKILFEKDAVVPVGEVIALIETEGAASSSTLAAPAAVEQPTPSAASSPSVAPAVANTASDVPYVPATTGTTEAELRPSQTDRFYSPLVRNIAAKEGVSRAELDALPGSGKEGRVTKRDILGYLERRGSGQPLRVTPVTAPAVSSTPARIQTPPASPAPASPSPSSMTHDGEVEIIEMDRMRKLIAKHMVQSVQTSPHVTSYVEADVTNLVRWRDKVKKEYANTYGEKITFTPLFIESIIKALRDFPMVNISVDGDHIIRHKHLNIGMAAALPSGNLIVPVIHDADHLNLVGLTSKVNDLAQRARKNELKPHEIQGGTFTLTNVGTFGNVMGTPIINQPQAAILAAGAIRKRPAVLETPQGDVIAIRHMMFLSLSYDHRVVDGMLGGSFLRRIADYLEQFDIDRNDI